MGVIPWRASHSFSGAEPCRLCTRTTRARSRSVAAASRRLGQLAIPLAVLTALAVALRETGIASITLGAIAGILVAWAYVNIHARRLRLSTHEAHAAEVQAIAEDADARVDAVVKQFEWAVQDVATLRSALEEHKVAVRTLTERVRDREHRNEQLVRQISRLRERLTEIAMAASLEEAGKAMRKPLFEAVPFIWGLHLDGPRARLELQTPATAESPTRLRVMDRDGQVMAVSGMAVVSLDGSLEFQLEPPLDLVADLDAGREINYAIEALVDDEWRPVRLQDTGRRTTTVVDVNGHLSRVSETREAPMLSATWGERRSTLN